MREKVKKILQKVWQTVKDCIAWVIEKIIEGLEWILKKLGKAY